HPTFRRYSVTPGWKPVVSVAIRRQRRCSDVSGQQSVGWNCRNLSKVSYRPCQPLPWTASAAQLVTSSSLANLRDFHASAQGSRLSIPSLSPRSTLQTCPVLYRRPRAPVSTARLAVGRADGSV